MNFASYDTAEFYDEMFLPDGCACSGARLLKERIESLPDGDLLLRQEAAERLLLQSGITFNVYGDNAASEKFSRLTSSPASSRLPNGTGSRKGSNNAFVPSIFSSTISTTSRRSSETKSFPNI
jgi:uncharacterized circularly permuted ATP-grasp superfamily protein